MVTDAQVRKLMEEHSKLTQYLTTGVAHSLNTALQEVLGYSGLLAESGGLSPDLIGPSRQLYQVAADASRLVSHLVSLADSGDGTPAGVEPVGLFAAAITTRRSYLDANNVTVTLPDPDADTLVWADPVKVRRALSRVVANAARVALAQGAGSLELTVERNASEVVLTLAATGPGYPDEVVSFERGDFGPNVPDIVTAHAMAMGLIEDVGGRLFARNTSEAY